MIGWKTLLHSQAPDAGVQPLLSLDELKLRVAATLAGCDSAVADRLRMATGPAADPVVAA